MSFADLSLAFTLGLVGSLHCVQMCGPLVLAYSLPLSGTARGRQWLAHAWYNTGRITTYTVLGALGGSLGGALAVLGSLAGAVNVAALVAGGLMILAGLSMLGLVRFPAALTGRLPRRFSLAPMAGRFLRSTSPLSKLAMGLVLGLLPCGLLYAGLLKAIETGSAQRGAATMVAFGIGTAGALLLTGLFSATLANRLGRWTGRLPAIAVLMTGAFLLWRGMMGIGPAAPRCH